MSIPAMDSFVPLVDIFIPDMDMFMLVLVVLAGASACLRQPTATNASKPTPNAAATGQVRKLRNE